MKHLSKIGKRLHSNYIILPGIVFLVILLFISFYIYETKRPNIYQSRALEESGKQMLSPQNNYILNSDLNSISPYGSPANFNIITHNSQKSPRLNIISDKRYTYVNNRSIYLETYVNGDGFSLPLADEMLSAQPPFFFQINVLPVSGGIKMEVKNKNGDTIAQEQTEDNVDLTSNDLLPKWKTLAVVADEPVGEVTVSSVLPSENPPDVASKAYIANFNARPFGDFPWNEISPNASEMYLKDCTELEGDETNRCIKDKVKEITGKEISDEELTHPGEPKLLFNDEEIKPESVVNTQGVFLTGATGVKQQYDVANIFFATDFSDFADPQRRTLFQQNILETMNRESPSYMYKDTGITKYLNLQSVVNKPFIPFSPFVKTACKIQGYWHSFTAYLPDDWCTKEYQGKLQYAFIRVGGWDANGGDKVFIDNYGGWNGIMYLLKHETLHLFGAVDNDFVEIRGRGLFPDGNTKAGSPYDDIMYRSTKTNVSEYTIGLVNRIDGWNCNMFNKFQPKQLKLIDASTGDLINYGKYIIYEGNPSTWHYKGYISFSGLIAFGDMENGIISKDKNNLFLGSPCFGPVAGFIKLTSDNKLYTGQFDLIDLSVCSFRGQDPCEVKMTERKLGNVQFINPKENGETINSLGNLYANVEPTSGNKLKAWRIFITIDGNRDLLSEGGEHIGNSSLYIPDEKLRKYKDYNGKLALELEADFTPVDNIDNNMIFTMRDTRTDITLENKPVIKKVTVIGLHLMIEGKGYGNSGATVTITDALSGIEVDSFSNNYSMNKKYNSSLKVADDYIDAFIHQPIDPNDKWPDEDFSGQALDVIVTRGDGISTDVCHYGGKSASGSTDPFIIISEPSTQNGLPNAPNGFVYDSGQNETLTHHFELKCRQPNTQIVFGIETLNRELNNKYVEWRDDCNNTDTITHDFPLTSDEADSIYDSAGRGEYYWFVCARGLPPRINRADNEEGISSEDTRITKMLNLDSLESQRYTCRIEPIKLQRRSYSLNTPTPVSTIEPVH